MLIRFFAGAAEAAGVPERSLDVASTATGADVVAALTAERPELAKVLACSTLLVDGVRLTDRLAVIGDADLLDVLPPFAGG